MRGRLPAAILLAVLVAVPACEKIDRNMWDNPAHKAQEEAVLLPPADSVPTKGLAHVPTFAEAPALANPLKPTERNLSNGKELFRIHCTPCHGVSGKGDGPVGKKFRPTPADLRRSSPVGHFPDGQIFVIISRGLGRMPAFRADITPTDRWEIISYLRTLK